MMDLKEVSSQMKTLERVAKILITLEEYTQLHERQKFQNTNFLQSYSQRKRMYKELKPYTRR